MYVVDESDDNGHEVFAKKLENLDTVSLSNQMGTEALVSGRLDNTLLVDSSENTTSSAHQVVLHR